MQALYAMLECQERMQKMNEEDFLPIDGKQNLIMETFKTRDIFLTLCDQENTASLLFDRLDSLSTRKLDEVLSECETLELEFLSEKAGFQGKIKYCISNHRISH